MRKGRIAGVLLVVGLVICPLWPRAEVSVDHPGDDHPSWLSMSLQPGGDDADPYPWGLRRRSIPGAWVLNPDGDVRGDGHPAAAFFRGEFRPVVTWSTAEEGGERDVVLSEWNGTTWTAPETVAGGPAVQRGPDVEVFPDGGLVVTWWEDDGSGGRIVVRKRSMKGQWSPPEELSPAGEDGRWPAVTVMDGVVIVGWLRDRGDGTREVIVAREDTGWAPQVVGETGYDGPFGDGNASLELHAVDSLAWADWRLAGDRIGTTRRDPVTGEWCTPEEIPCENSPDGRRLARWEAKCRALAGSRD